MARSVDRSEVISPDGPRRTAYPWDQWGDGEWWRLERGVDFEASVSDFRANAYQLARRRGMKARTRIRGNVVFLQFIPRSDPRPEIDGEDER